MLDDDLVLLRGFNDNIQFVAEPKIHIRLQKRDSRKFITIIQGLEASAASKILSRLRKKAGCGGNLKLDDDNATIIQLQGDVRVVVHAYLVSVGYASGNIITHGF